MYCKNCGKEIPYENAICSGCGFRGDNGESFCPSCGKATLPGQAKCLSCGAILEEDCKNGSSKKKHLEKRSKSKAYLSYTANVKKINIFSLIMQSLSIVLLLCLLFLPIYKSKYEPELEDIESLEQLGEAMEKGYLEKSFSLFDEIKIIVAQLTSPLDGEAGNLLMMIDLAGALFVIFEVIFGCILLCTTISSLIDTVSSLKNNDKSTMLLYNEMLKSGNENKKENVWKKQSVLVIFVYGLFDIFFAKITGRNAFGISITENSRNMENFTGFSAIAIVVLVLLIGYIVMNSLKKHESKRMLLSITQAEYDK